jgi:hypothetical protein
MRCKRLVYLITIVLLIKPKKLSELLVMTFCPLTVFSTAIGRPFLLFRRGMMDQFRNVWYTDKNKIKLSSYILKFSGIGGKVIHD